MKVLIDYSRICGMKQEESTVEILLANGCTWTYVLNSVEGAELISKGYYEFLNDKLVK